MRERSIISIIKEYGLNSKKLDPNYRLKYKAVLDDLSIYNSGSLKLIRVIDNVVEPEKSKAKNCMIKGCGKHIRYEYQVLDKITGKYTICGSNCCCTLLGLSKLQSKSLLTVESALKERAELEKWIEENPNTLNKLKKLSQYNLPFYKPFIDEVKHSALTKQDTDFINEVNLKLLLSDLKYLDVIEDLLKYRQKDIYKSIRDHVLVEGKYLSNKQKQLLASDYEQMLKNRSKITIVIHDAYDFKDNLKQEGYQYFYKNKTWRKSFNKSEKENVLKRLNDLGIPEDNINCY